MPNWNRTNRDISLLSLLHNSGLAHAIASDSTKGTKWNRLNKRQTSNRTSCKRHWLKFRNAGLVLCLVANNEQGNKRVGSHLMTKNLKFRRLSWENLTRASSEWLLIQPRAFRLSKQLMLSHTNVLTFTSLFVIMLKVSLQSIKKTQPM